MVGSLVTVKGLITRVTNVKPQIVVAAYSWYEERYLFIHLQPIDSWQ